MNTSFSRWTGRGTILLVLLLSLGYTMAQRVEVVFSGDLHPKTVDRLRQAVAAHPGHVQNRVVASRKHIWMQVQQGSAIDERFFEDLLTAEGLQMECFYRSDAPASSPATYAQFRACMEAQRSAAGKITAFNTCTTPMSVCDGQVVPITPWGPGTNMVFCPDPPKNPQYDPFFTPSPWVNPWLSGSNYGCLQSGENHTIWLRITITTPGFLEWAFRFPDFDGLNYIYMDWSLFPRTPSICADIAANNAASAPLRCNWNDWPETPNAATGMVRLASSIPISNEEDNFEVSFSVVAAAQYLLLLDNYSAGNFNGSFDFSLSGASAGVCGVVLPMGHTELVAEVVEKGVDLGWLNLDAGNFASCELQRASTGGTFSTIRSLSSHEFLTVRRHLDQQPLVGKSEYRIRRVDVDGNVTYSNVAEVEWNKAEFDMYPVPAHGAGFHIRPMTSATSVAVYDAKGQCLYFQDLPNGKVHLEDHYVPIQLASGLYLVEVRDGTGQPIRRKLVVQ